MAAIAVLVRMVARPGGADALRTALLASIESARQRDDITSYSVLQEDEDPDVFWTYRVFPDADAMDAYGFDPAMAERGRELAGLLRGPHQVICTTLLGTFDDGSTQRGL